MTDANFKENPTTESSKSSLSAMTARADRNQQSPTLPCLMSAELVRLANLNLGGANRFHVNDFAASVCTRVSSRAQVKKSHRLFSDAGLAHP